ncbi:MAG: hypothetical protein R3C01_16775 [Planctomycetaceae bacterium]
MRRLMTLCCGLAMSAVLVGCRQEATPTTGSGEAATTTETSTDTGNTTGGGDVNLGDPGTIELGTPAESAEPPANAPSDSSTEGPILPAPKNP